MTRKSSDEEAFSGLAFKIMTDPFVGSLTFVRVYSGVLEVRCRREGPAAGRGGGVRGRLQASGVAARGLSRGAASWRPAACGAWTAGRPADPGHTPGRPSPPRPQAGSYVLSAAKGKKERVGRLMQMHANSREDVKEARAGDIVAIAGARACRLRGCRCCWCFPRHGRRARRSRRGSGSLLSWEQRLPCSAPPRHPPAHPTTTTRPPRRPQGRGDGRHAVRREGAGDAGAHGVPGPGDQGGWLAVLRNTPNCFI